ncbi:endonuclease MutS2 [Desulfolutivibrio sulfoxidireducens]|uniref:endonuclease MutS2 n=1 Tax=Desulfolutivibrio sulfoxidireducens TaxID=2773299 RepID=UPI00159DACDE|nr:Smr/MutS family protein [Desulfolutivibrio sulfoxidireducens]QLA19947.1 endonuclease MutS2 [Desulfolutivibrio sulfoxidireducens]
MDTRSLQLLEFHKVLGSLADLAVSIPGRLACAALSPLSDPDMLFRRQRLLAECLELRRDAHFRLAEFPDLAGLFPALGNESVPLDLDALFALQAVLTQADEARRVLAPAAPSPGSPGGVRPLLREMAESAPAPHKTMAALARCLSPDGGLRDESSPELFSARAEIRAVHRTCTRQVRDYVQGQGLASYLQDDFITISSDRYVLPLKSNFKGRIPGIIHDYSQTGETCYFEPFFLVEVNNRLQELKKEEREAEARVLAFLSGLCRQEQDGLAAFSRLLVDLDVLLACAALAEAMAGTIPDVGPDEPVRLPGARHPLLLLAASDPSRVVPQDIILEPSQRALIISGANAGGKTVCLKTLGLLALMAFSGLAVPAAPGCGLPHWRKVFVFLGDEQSLEDHLSTFTAQIRHLSRAWPQVDQDTLVLLDEFGAGTDPAQGAALAQAVVDGLLEKNAWLAAATHFPALKAYGLSKPGVRAACMLFDPAGKKPLYGLAYDQVGASVALDVAREHGLPEDLLVKAHKYLLMEGADSSSILDRLNVLALRKQEELDELAELQIQEKKKTVAIRERYEKRLAALLDEVRETSREIARSYQEGRLGRKQAQKALAEAGKRLIEENAAVSQPSPGDSAKPSSPDFDGLKPGDLVHLPGWNKSGRVLDKDPKRRMVKVDLGGVCLWVDAREVAEASGREAKKAGGGWSVKSASDQGGQSAVVSAFVLDLRGRRADEAVAELAAFLDDSVLKGRTQLEIVHGKGTGALRREVHDFLRTAPQVASFRLAPADRGGDGMTMVELG